ncbi:hypothetical protein ACFSE1_15975 [Rhizobium helianthi]|uniref:Uncharacterized protein n=1 Tax=Rhizobium helianthi TaxID=1132695 RepID=A0ABW4M6Z7_9HYPH
MNGATLFFLYGLPVLIVAGGWVAVVLNERNASPKHHIHPGE